MLRTVGANFWSGSVLGLDMPNNPADPTFNPLNPPTEVTGSFITLSHAVKKTGALNCNDCHTPTSVLDFQVLGYLPSDATRLQTLLQAVQSFTSTPTPAGLKLNWATIPGRTYQLQTSTNLSTAAWTPFGANLTATNRAMERLVAPNQISTEPRRFFRVMEISP
jgi:hypothetical protein